MLRTEVFQSIQKIGVEQWSALADPAFPFTGYHYLLALETSDSVGARTGWFPRFVTAWEDTELVGALVLYLKTNSYGEYIFDFAWADVYERCGLPYFPKLTSAIPFTPATGTKILIKPGFKDAEITRALLEGADKLAKNAEASSIHCLFIPGEQSQIFESCGYFTRESFQFHWRNRNYASFADFLASLKSKRRKEISRERAQVVKAPVLIQRLTGEQIKDEHGDLFYEFYLSTIDKRQSHDYLTQDFFRRVFTNMKDQILFVLAQHGDGTPVAGALYYFGQDKLYGRNWGCLEEYRSLHFELCYYQGIEFAIERNFKCFEAGAQGEHKFQRGFLPSRTYSAHKIAHPELSQAIQDHVVYEKNEIVRLFETYTKRSPFT